MAREFIEKQDSLNQGREKLNRSIDRSYDADTKSDKAIKDSGEALTTSLSVRDELNQVVIDGDSSVEAAQARVGADGTNYSVLKERLDVEHEKVTTQLAHTTSELQAYVPRLTDLERELSEAIGELKAERGSNENGHWIKRPDGTMLCWTYVSMTGGEGQEWGSMFYWDVNPNTWVFPQNFIEPPSLTVSGKHGQKLFVSSHIDENKVVGMNLLRPSGENMIDTQLTIYVEGIWSNEVGGSFLKGYDYPSYWDNHINQKITTANNLQNQSLDIHSFIFITDMHMSTNEGHSFDLVRKTVNDLQLQTVVNGGDYANNGPGDDKAHTLRQIKQAVDGFTPIHSKVMNTMGNHDDNSVTNLWDQTLLPPEQFKKIFQFMGNNSVYGNSGKYHYRDDVFHKTRYIVLDTIDIPYIKQNSNLKYLGIKDYAYRQEQIDWFANVALNTPKDWTVAVFSHSPPYKHGVMASDYDTVNQYIMRGLLGAYAKGNSYSGSHLDGTPSEFMANISKDFTNRGGDVIGWFSGHVHYDNIVKVPEGFHLITTLNDGGQRWLDAPPIVAGTTDEHAFDIVSVDKNQRKIYLTRVGAGSDRVVSY